MGKQSFSYNPSTLKIKEGQKVSLILNNSDYIDHDIEIKSIPIQNNLVDSQHSSHHSESNIHLHSEANSSNQLIFTPLAKGTYEFYCSTPGHKENGMTGTLTVY
ncbi:plastocyanin/azurin family copper-binding protein [Bacillus litorisediminis]|uniref:plastocyanin/azurin family copper-binding protein n=1 Tax=Bacillus litorisediminis TaxID=2922713 RepID=UPI0036F210A7